ncbi:MAG: DUF3047 domain-containing protein [Candidatus Omnitrophica bacterium]|nr:DUF3047 domain-containing protein [Candidatus Omnitrophota bacterium]MBI2173757.1 DUF3047 domain-containing protein [Candidatus Omnitrophota bacterium]MBI3010107.1 DUF3047 domain-containing protein [Candidatus Omnitrophota bacterium]
MAVTAIGCGTRPITVSVVPPLIPPAPLQTFWKESFDTLQLDLWREVEVRHRTRYEIVNLQEHRCLLAESKGGASILIYPLRFNPDRFEWLSWQWRVDQLIEKENLTRKEGSDAAARVYVYFDTKGLPWQKHHLDYVWSSHLPVGTAMNSAYSKNSKIIVVESGNQFLGQWRSVSRNIEEDYRRCFNADPPDVVAIGVMSDTDNTQGQALAYFDELRVHREPSAD